MDKEFKYIWEGIYSSFSEAPADDGVFISGEWLKKQSARIEAMRKDDSSSSITSAYALTPILATMADGINQVRVLDFGGGLGTEYLSAVGSINKNHSVDFTIIDNDAICERGRKLFSGDDDIRFSSGMPDVQRSFDVVHAGSSIQYVDDWKSLLNTFASYAPKYILLSEVVAGDNPSFVTVQQWYGKGILVRFLNMGELQDFMSEIGYELILKQSYISKSNGNGEPLPMGNFPEKYQVKYTTNLTFSRINDK